MALLRMTVGYTHITTAFLVIIQLVSPVIVKIAIADCCNGLLTLGPRPEHFLSIFTTANSFGKTASCLDSVFGSSLQIANGTSKGLYAGINRTCFWWRSILQVCLVLCYWWIFVGRHKFHKDIFCCHVHKGNIFQCFNWNKACLFRGKPKPLSLA